MTTPAPWDSCRGPLCVVDLIEKMCTGHGPGVCRKVLCRILSTRNLGKSEEHRARASACEGITRGTLTEANRVPASEARFLFLKQGIVESPHARQGEAGVMR